MSQDTGDRFVCEVCEQWVRASRWGFGPWCDLYFGELGRACLPRTLAAMKFYEEENRPEAARLLKVWASRYWNMDGVDYA